MSKERFDHLLSLIREKITKKDTSMCKPISAEERLIIMLRYLSAEMSQQTLSYNFRVGCTTISNILREVSQAIFPMLTTICPNVRTTGTTSLCYHGNILTSLEKYKHLVLRPKTFRFQKNFNRLRYPR